MRTPANEQFQLDQLNDWRMLIDVVKARSMKIAAQNLGVDPSTVTRRIDKLETTMGTKFLLRSNQGLELTPEGRVAFANISHILAEYDAFLASFQRSQKEPPQKISITCPSVLADCDLIGLITDFQKRYPQTYFEIYDTPEEIKGEPDLSYWFGTPACRDKSRLQPICSFHPVLAVAPSYIEKYGEPKEPEDILKTPVFFFYLPTGGEGTTLTFTKNGETRDVRIDPSLRSSAYLPLVPSALGGEGVLANINSLMVDNYLKTSDLKLILTDWKLPAVPIYQEVNPARERDPLISQFIEEVLTHVHGIIKDIPGFMGYEESPGGIF